MKRTIFLILACMVLLTSFSSCECNHDWLEATCARPKTCAKCKETKGSVVDHNYDRSQRPARCTWCRSRSSDTELGFYYLEEMENALVPIEGYQLKDHPVREDFVAVKGTYFLKFEDDCIFKCKFSINNNKCVFDIPDEYIGKYEVINNDNLTYNNGMSKIVIRERETIEDRERYIILKEDHDTWYIPYSLVAWDKATRYDYKNDCYLLPLK